MKFTRLAFPSVLAALLSTMVPHAASASDSDTVEQYHCSNCYKKCGSWLFDLQCHLDKTFCLSTVALVGGILIGGTASCKIEHNENYAEANGLIQEANDILVEKNLFSQTFVESVNVFFCELPPDGLAPTNKTVLIKATFSASPALELAKLLAHQYYHTFQHRNIGTENLYCQYIENSIVSLSGNPIEKEAIDFEQDAGKCLFENEGCPSVPLI